MIWQPLKQGESFMDATSAILAAVNQSALTQAEEDAFNASVERARASVNAPTDTVTDPVTEAAIVEAVGSVIISSVVLPIIMQTVGMAQEAGEGFE
jgi:hypothetical protein